MRARWSARGVPKHAVRGEIDPGSITEESLEPFLSMAGAPEPDLFIRTGGEQRLSDFMLWECAYAELYFTPVLWPDFGAEGLAAAVEEFHSRDRRFGRIPESVAV